MNESNVMLTLANFNFRAGGGYVEYCTEGPLAGHRYAVCRINGKGASARRRAFAKFLILHNFSLADIKSPKYWDKVRECRGEAA